MVSKSEVDLSLRSVSLLEVIGEIRMGDIERVTSTWLNGDQYQWLGMKDTRSLDKKGFD